MLQGSDMAAAWDAENSSRDFKGSIAGVQFNITVIYLFCQSRYAIEGR